MKIAIVLGTRPEIIKMAPIIRECEKRDLDYFTLHTGQHYSYEMDRIFFEELELPQPERNLEVGSGTHAQQTGKIMVGIEEVLDEESPDVVLLQGDTNTVLAGALSASKMHINVGHVEAGLRSFDRRMPEEINRVVADHLSDYLFAPTKVSRDNLIKEGIADNKIFVTGNTIVDSVYQNKSIASRKVDVFKDLGISPRKYFLVTAHRAENVDSVSKLKEIIMGLSQIRSKFELPVVFPLHPRTRKNILKFGLEFSGIQVVDPLGFLEFLQLEANAKLVLTDSGGVQEECCILGVPCVTMRDSTERPESVDEGSNILVGCNSEHIFQGVLSMASLGKGWANPYGDGKSAKLIINILTGSDVYL